MFRKQARPSTFVVPKQGSFSQTHYNPSLITMKPNEVIPQPKKASQVVRPQETVCWGLTKGENTYETSYRHQFRDNSASKIPKVAVPEPIYPHGSLSGSLIPSGTPKFTRGKKFLEPTYLTPTSKLADQPPVNRRKQFTDMKHKDDYTKDHSPRSYREFRELSRTPSPHSQSSRYLHIHHSQVQENFRTEPTTPADLSNDVSLYCKTLDDSKAAGVSTMKKRVHDGVRGKRHMSHNNSFGVRDILKSCNEDIIQPSTVRKELKSTFTKPVQALALRTSENLESYVSRTERSVSPSIMRCDSPFSRRSLSPAGISPRRSITPEATGSISARDRVRMNRVAKSTVNIDRTVDYSVEKSRASTPRIPSVSYHQLKAEQDLALNKGSKTSRPSYQRAQTPTLLKSHEKADGSYSARGELKKTHIERKPSTIGEKQKTNQNINKPITKVTRSKLLHSKPGVFSGTNKKYSGLAS